MPSFSKLSEEAKKTARNRFRSGDYPFGEWWNSIYEDTVKCAECLGIEINSNKYGPEIFFSGFWSQGDGAMFLGEYMPRIDACITIAAHAPQDEELKRIAEALTQFQVAAELQYSRQIKGEIIQYGGGSNYSHSGCMYFNATFVDEPEEENSVAPSDEAILQKLFRTFADWIYKQLEKEYEYLCSDEYIDECLQDDKFDEEGNLI